MTAATSSLDHSSRSARRRVTVSLLGVALSSWGAQALADNPIVQHVYTADPAPMVHGDAVYVCTSHDEDVTVDDFFTMNDWFVFSSKDMVNWTDHGSPLSWETFSWASANHSWAPHCVERGGKFYFFVPVSDAIGVAVSESPTGPFVDAIGAPLLQNYQYIDPTVFVDDDGQAYLYFGNPRLWYVKLNDDMTSYSGQIEQIPNTVESFGQRSGDPDRPTNYEEGPWFFKRSDQYYMMYAAVGVPESIGYSTSPGPTGPWTYQGIIMGRDPGLAFTNHAGVVDFKGHSYFFYHTEELPGGGGFKRSVAVEEFSYGADGSFPTIPKTDDGVTESVDPLIPYYRTEGETMAWGEGIEIEDCEAGGRDVSNIEDGDYIKVESVDFLTGATSFEASVASSGAGGTIELHLDSVGGPAIGTCNVEPTGGWQSWSAVSCDVSGAEGMHDLFLVFKGGGGSLFNLDYWLFTPKDPLPTGMGGAGGMSGTGGTAGAEGFMTGGAAGGPSGSSGGAVSAGAGGAPSAGGNGQMPSNAGAGTPSSVAGGPAVDPALPTLGGGAMSGGGDVGAGGAPMADVGAAGYVPATVGDGAAPKGCAVSPGSSRAPRAVWALAACFLVVVSRRWSSRTSTTSLRVSLRAFPQRSPTRKRAHRVRVASHREATRYGEPALGRGATVRGDDGAASARSATASVRQGVASVRVRGARVDEGVAPGRLEPPRGDARGPLGRDGAGCGDGGVGSGPWEPRLGGSASVRVRCHPIFGSHHPIFGDHHPVFGSHHPVFGDHHPVLGDHHPVFRPARGGCGEWVRESAMRGAVLHSRRKAPFGLGRERLICTALPWVPLEANAGEPTLHR